MKERKKACQERELEKKESRLLFSCGTEFSVLVRHNHGCTSLKEADVASARLWFVIYYIYIYYFYNYYFYNYYNSGFMGDRCFQTWKC